MPTRYERAPAAHIERPHDMRVARPFIWPPCGLGHPLSGMGMLRDMAPITLTIEPDDVAIVRRLLLKMQAGELADLRRAQTQLSVYGDRRASMAGEPGAIEARLA